MDEQFKPIELPKEEQPSTGFTEIKPEVQEPRPVSPMVNVRNDEVLKSLPEWNLEPPIEINRGNS